MNETKLFLEENESEKLSRFCILRDLNHWQLPRKAFKKFNFYHTHWWSSAQGDPVLKVPQIFEIISTEFCCSLHERDDISVFFFFSSDFPPLLDSNLKRLPAPVTCTSDVSFYKLVRSCTSKWTSQVVVFRFFFWTFFPCLFNFFFKQVFLAITRLRKSLIMAP